MGKLWNSETIILVLSLIFGAICMPVASASTDLTSFDRCSFNSVSGTYAQRQVKEVDYLLSPNGDPAAIMFAGSGENLSGLQYPGCTKELNFHANLVDYGDMEYFIEEHSIKNSPYSYTVDAGEICSCSLPEIEESGLMYPDGPVIAFGSDLKLRVIVGIDYREPDCEDDIMRIYEIVSRNAAEIDPLYEFPPVIFSREHVVYLD